MLFAGLLAEKPVDIKRGGYKWTSRGACCATIGLGNGYSVNISQIDLTQFLDHKHIGETPALQTSRRGASALLTTQNHWMPKSRCYSPPRASTKYLVVTFETTQVHWLNFVATRFMRSTPPPESPPRYAPLCRPADNSVYYFASPFYMRNLTSSDIDFVNSVVV